ncbi:hypothetical protein ABBQ32_002255 [Trebouxia sp. C0010 RCD-2024]
MSAESLPEFGFVFDIDGVLIRGWDLLPNAKEALKKVHDSGVPYLFVTNNGMDTEDERAKILSDQFDIPVTNKSMVLNHSALQNHANDFGDNLVLVTGYSRTDLKGILTSYGFKNVALIADYAACHPHALPNKKYGKPQDRDWADKPVAAVVVVETPENWHEDLQIICDLLRSNGNINELATDNKQHVKLFNCNFDFTYAEHFHTARFGPGAFIHLLDVLFHETTGRHIEIIRHGKPNKPAYDIAAKKLQAQLDVLAKKTPGSENKSHKLKHVYAVGDNPKSDVRGANSAGNMYRSILVCTGVYKGGVDSNDEQDPAHYVVQGVGEAVDKVFQIENERAMGRRASQETARPQK